VKDEENQLCNEQEKPHQDGKGGGPKVEGKNIKGMKENNLT
jgi:hypothetical protein